MGLPAGFISNIVHCYAGHSADLSDEERNELAELLREACSKGGKVSKMTGKMISKEASKVAAGKRHKLTENEE